MADTPHNSNFDGLEAHARPNCLHCELSLTDALDGTLSPAEQLFFDGHVRSCVRCAELYAEAQRGAAWLELLKNPRPQPRPELLAKILAQTSGNTLGATVPLMPAPAGLSAPSIPGFPMQVPGRLLAFSPRPTAMHRLGRIMLEPRLAMTAAMAFFSITLTMSLTGVRLNDLHARDFSPSGLRRTAHGVQAGAVRYYDNLRVVHVLESRVDDLRENLQGREQQATPQAAPSTVTPSKHKPEKHDAPTDGGSSSLHPQGSEPLSILTSMVASLTLWTPDGDRA